MRKDSDFDPMGRVRPINHQLWLEDCDRRTKRHLRDCIKCLRHAAGLGGDTCGVAKQIQRQREAVQRGMKAKQSVEGGVG